MPVNFVKLLQNADSTFSPGPASLYGQALALTGAFTITDANFVLGTTTGTKIGTAPSQKLGFWNATPIVQPTTSVTGATHVGGGGTTLTDTDTFDGYTIAKVVKALINVGLLA